MFLKQPYEQVEYITPMINVGAGMDVISGRWYYGKFGEAILNGGLGIMSGYVGPGNIFKTATMVYRELRAMARISPLSTGSMYETELNTQPDRLVNLGFRIPEFEGIDLILSGRFVHTNRTKAEGDQWYETTKDWLREKYKEGKDHKEFYLETPFLRKGSDTERMKMIIPTFGMLDSLTEFYSKDVIKLLEKHEMGDDKAKTSHMNQGWQKSRLLSELPPFLHRANHYMGFTAHVGTIIQMDMYNPEKKALAAMQGNVKIKGAGSKFTTNMNSVLQFYAINKLINKTTKMSEFPRDEYDDMPGDSDLNVVHVMELRGKNGPSGTPHQIVVSQHDGVLPEMTEFWNIKNYPGRFGFEGNDTNYSLALCPDVKLSRTKVRTKIAENPMLCRALNITCELMQMSQMMPEFRAQGLMCTPKELFDGIKEKGYDWDQILGETRGWWTLNNEDHPTKFLSTLDLLRMRVDKYKPYWM